MATHPIPTPPPGGEPDPGGPEAGVRTRAADGGAVASMRPPRRCSDVGDGLVIDSDAPVIVLPAHGVRCPDTVALLALWLAGEEHRVLVHGSTAPAAVGAGAVLADLGIAAASTAHEVTAAWRRRQPAFVDAALLAPRMAGAPIAGGPRLEAISLLNPIRGARSLRVVGAPDRAAAVDLGETARRRGLDLMVVGAPAGSCVASLNQQPRIDTWIDGLWRVELSLVERPLTHLEMPLLPPITDAAANAVWVQSVLSGERPLPLPIERQVERLIAAMHLLDAPADATRRTASHRAGASPPEHASPHSGSGPLRD